MVAELSKNVRTLTGNGHGRHVLRACRVELYERSPEQWRSAIRGADRRKQMFDSTFGAGEGGGGGGGEGEGEGAEQGKKRSGDVKGEGGEEEGESGAPAKKKRKRKRKKKE